MNDKIRILCIAPYESLKNTVLRIANERNDIEVTVEVGLIRQGAEIVQKMDLNDFDIILSRGGTMMEIKKVTDKPVFEIPISHLDILDIMKLVESYVGRVAIVVYENIEKTLKKLCNILNYDYDIFVVKSLQEAKILLENLKERGYTLIIGDAAATLYTSKLGLQSLLITSGPSSVSEAFDNVVNIYSYFINSTRENLFFKTFANSHELNCLVLNSDGDAIFSTYTSEKKSPISVCRSIIPTITQGTVSVVNKKLSEGFFIITGSKERLIGGTYYLFSIKRSKLIRSQLSGFKSIEIHNHNDILEEVSQDYFDSHKIHPEVWKKLNLIVKSTTSILITGEAGTEKEKLARQIYLDSTEYQASFYVINCTNLTERELNNILTNEKSPIFTLYATIHFKGMNLLKKELRDRLLKELKSMSWTLKCRFIFTYELNYDNNSPEIDAENRNSIKNNTSSIEIEIPPLRNRYDLISNLSILCIHHQNLTNEIQYVGLEPEAQEILCSYSWPENFNQLYRVLKEAMIYSTDSTWISSKSIKHILSSEKTHSSGSKLSTQINLNQPMESIMYDIALLIMKEENMNQVKTAKRLGISRTTLWRILKNNN